VNQNRASINKRLPASINIGIIFLPRHSQADCRASLIQIVAPHLNEPGSTRLRQFPLYSTLLSSAVEAYSP
ncbi:hypothetical protein, partial [Paraburkholderia sp. UCT31]|uniref:hypothetical protein n=1 Tax=Paraburkholderia sp. UCT31 TaxID=2615209 RepID=UPI001CA421A9